MSKLLIDALAGRPTPRAPLWLMRQAGRYLPEYRAVRGQARDFLDLCYSPDLAVEVTLQPLRRFDLDAAILFSDILVVPQALGWDVRFVEKEGPQLEPFRTGQDLSRLRKDGLREWLAPGYETVRKLGPLLPDNVTLIGFSGAPWTLAAYMVEGKGSRDFAEARKLARRDPQLFGSLIDLLTDAVIDHLCAQIEAGAEVVQVFDSWAGVLPESELRKWCLDPSRRIVRAISARHPAVPVILFPRGVGAGYQLYAAEAGMRGLALDTTVSIDWARESLPRDLCLQGNLDPMALLGPVDAMLSEAERILTAMAGRPHILNLGHGVMPETDPEAVAVLVRYLQNRVA
jgi:uroporphyrinogen decarboxylase